MFNFEPDLHRPLKVLIVDDDPDARELFSEILAEEGYLVETAVDGMEALDKLESFKPDLILTDYQMPRMDGITLCKIVKNNPETIDLGVILITGFNDFEVRVQGLSAGADDFLSKPVMLPELKARIKSLAKAKLYHDFLRDYQKRLEEEVEKKAADLIKANLALNLAYRELEDLSLEIVYRLARAAEYRDEHTGNHIQRISLYCVAIGERLGLTERQLDLLRYGSILHDIGKLGIPDEILLKPGSLTPEEWEIMKKHTIIGAEILKGTRIAYLKAGEKIALYHHERWDGKGYPFGLKGENIPLIARIVSVADVFDALTSKRPYRDAMDTETAFEFIASGKGTQFDPLVVDAFLGIKNQILEIKELYKDEGESHLFSLIRSLREQKISKNSS